MAEKKINLTALSVFACFAVVCLHTSGFWTFRKSIGWIAANAVESFFYFAVPVFLMISGATLIDYRERYGTAEYFKKRIKKTVIPFLFWSAFSMLFSVLLDGSEISLNPFELINSVLMYEYNAIYYFFIILYGIYISVPVISLIPRENRQRSFIYITAAAFTVNSLLPFISVLSGGRLTHNSTLNFYACSGYLIYPIIGYYLNNYSLSLKAKLAVLISGFIGLITMFTATAVLSFGAGEIVSSYKGYLSVPCVLYSSAVFLLFKMLPFERFPKFVIKVICFFGGQTFGIYLIHMFLYKAVGKVFDYGLLNPIERLVYAVILFSVSGIIIKLLQKLPFIRCLVP